MSRPPLIREGVWQLPSNSAILLVDKAKDREERNGGKKRKEENEGYVMLGILKVEPLKVLPLGELPLKDKVSQK